MLLQYLGQTVNNLPILMILKHTPRPSNSLAGDRRIVRGHVRVFPDGLKGLHELQIDLRR
jgi:hypothetical protein